MIIKNVAVKWACVQEPNLAYDPQYEVCIYPEGESLKMLIDAGIEMRQDKENGAPFYRAASKVQDKKGKKLAPPRVVDSNKNPFTELVGNDSICNVIVDIKEVPTIGGGSHNKGYLKAVQVVKHVPYIPSEDFNELDDNGVAKADQEDF